MAKKFDISHYKECLNFYLDRLHYYQNLLDMDDGYNPIEFKAWGYGSIPFKVNRKSSQFMYDYWFQGMVEFIQKEKCRTCERVKKK